MAFRKEALHATGGFRQWLGPGTIGQAAEDAEISMRLLLHGRTLAYEPNILVYHDKWLTTRGARRQQIPYARGETACYGYYYFHKHRFARLIIARAFQRETSDLIKWIGDLLRIRWNRKTLGSVWWISWSLLNRIEGLVIGFVASHLDPLTVRSAARKNP
jgi:cellulose synthase/poly-beta-1,6-N-acetylglucosamine synthase-like glycosyltransferase